MIRLALVQPGKLIDTYLASLPYVDNLNVTAVVAENTERAGIAANRLGVSLATTSLENLLQQQQDFDAIALHVPLEKRLTAIQLASAAGKHIFVTTPLAPTAEEARAIHTTCTKAAVRLMVTSYFRYLPSSLTLQEQLVSGKLGKPGLIRLHHWTPSRQHSVSLISQITAEIDVINWLMDMMPEIIFTLGQKNPDAQPGDIQIHLGYPTGAMAVIDIAHTLPVNSDPYYSLTLIGSTGAAYADDHRNVQLLFQGKTATAPKLEFTSQVLRQQLCEFSESILNNRQPTSNGHTDEQALLVARGAADSLQAGRPVRITGEQYELI